MRIGPFSIKRETHVTVIGPHSDEVQQVKGIQTFVLPIGDGEREEVRVDAINQVVLYPPQKVVIESLVKDGSQLIRPSAIKGYNEADIVKGEIFVRGKTLQEKPHLLEIQASATTVFAIGDLQLSF